MIKDARVKAQFASLTVFVFLNRDNKTRQCFELDLRCCVKLCLYVVLRHCVELRRCV